MFTAAWLAVRGFLGAIPRQVWFALAAGLLLWWAYSAVHSRGAASRDGEVAELQATIAMQHSAAAWNLATIAELQAANQELAQGREVDMQRAASAVAALIQEGKVLQDELQAERKRRAAIYAGDKDAKSWAETVVPGAVADQLRVRSDRPD